MTARRTLNRACEHRTNHPKACAPRQRLLCFPGPLLDLTTSGDHVIWNYFGLEADLGKQGWASARLPEIYW